MSIAVESIARRWRGAGMPLSETVGAIHSDPMADPDRRVDVTTCWSVGRPGALLLRALEEVRRIAKPVAAGPPVMPPPQGETCGRTPGYTAAAAVGRRIIRASPLGE